MTSAHNGQQEKYLDRLAHIRWKHNAALMEEQQKIETKRKQHSMINLEDLNQLEVCFAL